MSVTQDLTYMERRWEAGQRHLVAGHYVAARRDLETAEAIAWRERDGRTLARIYLPLLEARRQIRLNAAEGTLVICPSEMHESQEAGVLKAFLEERAGTILLGCSGARGNMAACRFAGSVQYAARRTGHWLESLLLIHHADETRMTTQADPTFAGGLTVRWTTDAKEAIGASTTEELVVPLPPTASYAAGDGLHGMARESLLVAWEALALKWQRRHPFPREGSVWDEIGWLRLALRIDPACEPVAMRLMALGEGVERNSECRVQNSE